MKGCLSFLVGAVIGVALLFLLFVIPMATAKMPPGQQDSAALAAGSMLLVGVPVAACIGGLIGWMIQQSQ